MIIEIKEKGLSVGHYEFSPNVLKNSDSLINYLSIEQRMSSQEVKHLLTKIPDTVSILKYIQIDTPFRKKGLGTKILKKIIQESNSSIFLIAETREDFLLDWYMNHGFEIIGHCHKLPILILIK